MKTKNWKFWTPKRISEFAVFTITISVVLAGLTYTV